MNCPTSMAFDSSRVVLADYWGVPALETMSTTPTSTISLSATLSTSPSQAQSRSQIQSMTQSPSPSKTPSTPSSPQSTSVEGFHFAGLAGLAAVGAVVGICVGTSVLALAGVMLLRRWCAGGRADISYSKLSKADVAHCTPTHDGDCAEAAPQQSAAARMSGGDGFELAQL